jgi:leader peptidase (prepilin peptidase)/N-methyltransferase
LIASLSIAFVAAATVCVYFLDASDALFGALLAAMVLHIAAVDVERFEIPDLANLAILLVGLAWQASELKIEDVLAAIVRCFVAGGLLFAVRLAYRRFRGIEGLGLGDVKLAGAGATWLAWSQMWFALSIAVGAAMMLVLVRNIFLRERIVRDAAIPFGAFLAPAIWIAWILQVSGT